MGMLNRMKLKMSNDADVFLGLQDLFEAAGATIPQNVAVLNGREVKVIDENFEEDEFMVYIIDEPFANVSFAVSYYELEEIT